MLDSKSNILNINLSVRQLLSLIKIYFPTCIFIFLVWFIPEKTNISVYELVADPNEVGNTAPYTGMVSSLGILLFCCAVSICFFSSYLIKVDSKQSRKWQLFFKFSGAKESIYIFSKVGLEPYGRYAIGFAELIASVLLVIPTLVWIGAAMSLFIMAGAIFFHLTSLGIEVLNASSKMEKPLKVEYEVM